MWLGQWSACLASTGFKPPALRVLGLVACACNLSAWEGEAGKSEVQDHPQKTTTKQHPLCLSVKSLVGRPEGYSKYRPKQNVSKIVFYCNMVTAVIFIQRAPNYLTLHIPDTWYSGLTESLVVKIISFFKNSLRSTTKKTLPLSPSDRQPAGKAIPKNIHYFTGNHLAKRCDTYAHYQSNVSGKV